MLEDRYKLNRDFIKRVIDPAQKELEASNAPYYFTYEKIKIGRAFRNVQLNIHYRPQYDKNTHKRVSIGWDIERNFLRKLEEVFGQEVNWKPHKELLVKAQDLEPEILVKILRGSQKASNPVGYFINALKRQLNNPGR
jgi:plasmid replication initiation protein